MCTTHLKNSGTMMNRCYKGLIGQTLHIPVKKIINKNNLIREKNYPGTYLLSGLIIQEEIVKPRTASSWYVQLAENNGKIKISYSELRAYLTETAPPPGQKISPFSFFIKLE